jgi:hypothetical protein
MTLADKLNSRNVNFVFDDCKLTLELVPKDDECDEDGVVIDEELNDFLDRLDKLRKFFNYHPYSKDGGFVVFVEDLESGEHAWYSPSEYRWDE